MLLQIGLVNVVLLQTCFLHSIQVTHLLNREVVRWQLVGLLIKHSSVLVVLNLLWHLSMQKGLFLLLAQELGLCAERSCYKVRFGVRQGQWRLGRLIVAIDGWNGVAVLFGRGVVIFVLIFAI